MDRRTFLCSTGFTALGAFLPGKPGYALPPTSDGASEPFHWSTKNLDFAFELASGGCARVACCHSPSPLQIKRRQGLPELKLRFNALEKTLLIRV